MMSGLCGTTTVIPGQAKGLSPEPMATTVSAQARTVRSTMNASEPRGARPC
jgi:hypothetical protein